MRRLHELINLPLGVKVQVHPHFGSDEHLTSAAVECPEEVNGEKGVWRTLEDEERSREADGQ